MLAFRCAYTRDPQYAYDTDDIMNVDPTNCLGAPGLTVSIESTRPDGREEYVSVILDIDQVRFLHEQLAAWLPAVSTIPDPARPAFSGTLRTSFEEE